MKPALLILDPQNDFFASENPNLPAFRRSIPVINAAIACFREKGWPVVFVQHTSKKKPHGSQDWAIYGEFDDWPGGLHVLKSHPNAFWESELDERLRGLGIDYVLVAGYLAEYCVLSTFRGALERSYGAAILKGGIASINDQHTAFVLEVSKMLDAEEFLALAEADLPG